MDSIHREIPIQFRLPRRISRLSEIAYNLWGTWDPDAQSLFAMIDKPLWRRLNHNAVSFLSKVERPRINSVIYDKYFLDAYDRVIDKFDTYIKADNTWFKQTYPEQIGKVISYFSFEFGLHESLPVYAGGLGILAGDHLKESSDLGLPMVAIGFIYRLGYFIQKITEDGWQETRNYELNLEEMPVIPLLGADEKPLSISVDLPGRKAVARIWEVRVGRVKLFLLDTHVEENNSNDRLLTSKLYSSDLEIRISQEILLGIGGVRALKLLGYDPDAWHMNEGHSAFLIIERLRELIETGKTYDEAAEIVKKTNVFTTHTPVPAGIDQYPFWMVDKYFSSTWQSLNLNREQFLNMAYQKQEGGGENYSMPVLALRLSDQRNGVSELHGQVSRAMWNFLWPDRKPDDVPISHITNGVHTQTWLARRMRQLFDRYLGPDWLQHIDDMELWQRVEDIPDDELWEVRNILKHRLIDFATERAREQWTSGTVHPVQVLAGGVLLEPSALTIGFGRRFATYKRGYLILKDYNRLLKIINNPLMPVQIVFAGKAHPADEPGKLIIQQVYRAVKDAKTGGRLVFLEDYDMNVARQMVQGVDVWLNTPRRPNEASGTSGIKAALNGVLNFSVLDGWWHEGFNTKNGWAIGGESNLPDANQQDDLDAESLYTTLEDYIIPLYYTRRENGSAPAEWMKHIKESIRTLVPQFSMQRMVKEYMVQMYLPALTASDNIEENGNIS